MARLAFFGSPDPAALCLAELANAGHEVVVAVTEPDRRRGRGSALMPTPVKRVAQELGIVVADEVDAALSMGADIGVVVAFGRLIDPAALDRLEMVNAHFSLLPRWRGAAPVERAILAGDAVTGVSLMRLEKDLDTGPVYVKVQVPILAHESASSLTARLAREAAALLVDRLAQGPAGLGEPVAQVGEPTYAAKVSPSERHIDWAEATEQVDRVVRIGRAWTSFRGRRVIIWEALASRPTPAPAGGAIPGRLEAGRVATGDGWLEPRVVQSEGRPRLAWEEWWRGARLTSGDGFV